MKRADKCLEGVNAIKETHSNGGGGGVLEKVAVNCSEFIRRFGVVDARFNDLEGVETGYPLNFLEQNSGFFGDRLETSEKTKENGTKEYN